MSTSFLAVRRFLQGPSENEGDGGGPKGLVHFYCAPYNDFGHPYRLNERKKPYHHRRKKLLERKNLTLAKVSAHLEKSIGVHLNRSYNNKTDQQIG